MTTRYAAATAHITATERAGIIDEYERAELAAQRELVRNEYFDHVERSTFDPAAIEWWENEGSSAYGVDDDTDYMGDELPTVIEFGTATDTSGYDIELSDYAWAEWNEKAMLAGHDLVILALKYSTSEYGSWAKDQYKNRLCDALGYFADSFIARSDETVANYRDYCILGKRITAMNAKFEAVKYRLTTIPRDMGHAEFSATVATLSVELQRISESIKIAASMRDHCYKLVQSGLAELIREDAEIAAWFAGFVM